MDIDSFQTDFADDSNTVNNIDKPQARQAAFRDLLDKILTTSLNDNQSIIKNVSAYIAVLIGGDVDVSGVTLTAEPLSITALRPLLDNFVEKLRNATTIDTDARIQIITTSIRLLRPRVTSFEPQDHALKLLLADLHEQTDSFTLSARALSTLNLDSTQRTITDDEKARIWVRIARCYLEEEDPISALASINRAKNVLHNVTDKATRLQFSISQARILDSQRQFLDASVAYYNMSNEPMVDEDDRLQALSASTTCAVLAPAGPQRARMLGRLYKDERATQIEEYSILSSIYLNQILSPTEVSSFAAKLQGHQLAKTADGSTVLDRAVLEHNLLGVSRLYRNIRTTNLGALLGVSGERAEEYAALMIEQGRLAGSIDQIEGVIFFEGDLAGLSAPNAVVDGQSQGAVQQHVKSGGELRRWDAAVQGLAEEVERVATMIQTAHPEFYAQHMAY